MHGGLRKVDSPFESCFESKEIPTSNTDVITTDLRDKRSVRNECCFYFAFPKIEMLLSLVEPGQRTPALLGRVRCCNMLCAPCKH